jgi:predicted RNase H-related nuclease YkuK (DUF458 family)
MKNRRMKNRRMRRKCPFLSITAYNVPFIVHATNPTDSCIIATDSNVIRSKTRFLSMILVLFTF